ncbi:glycosyltransferase [Acidaminococcus sp. NSJ-142]|uniref:glycosyltransferase n=1 Tax=Acidaminococcus hominis TaxID=2897706 RepID=UPI001E30A765|nr:glycosyltransferase [Acidaminococcus hominis]MCD2436362.1 glycosyltransferase [Acidaminococcus hominis]
MVKVLEVNVDDNGYGGVYAFVLNILENIDRKFQIDLCSFEKFEKQSNIDYVESFGGKVHYCCYEGNPIKKQLGCFKGLYNLIKNSHYDTVHIHSDVSYKLFLYGLAVKLGGASNILIHSHSTAVDGKHRNIKDFLHHLFRFFLPLIGDKFLACSQEAGKWMFLDCILRGKNFFQINNGINTLKFSYSSKRRLQVRKNLRLDDDFVVGHIGRFCYQKNHEFLIHVFNEIVKMQPNAKLLLVGSYVGDPFYFTITHKLVDKLGLDDNVLFLGIRNDVPDLMQAMDCFVLPSRSEGLGIVGIEAQAAGLPCFFSSEVPREVGVTNLSHFIALNTPLKKWAECIIQHSQGIRQTRQQEIRDAGYDAKQEIKRLERLYSFRNER